MTSIKSLQIANNATWWGNYTGGGGGGGNMEKYPFSFVESYIDLHGSLSNIV